MAKIVGNTIATPTPRPDWNQTDETKADYIKNKPSVRENIYIGLDGYCYSEDGIAYPFSNLNIYTKEDLKKYNFILIYDYEETGNMFHPELICDYIPLVACYGETGLVVFTAFFYNHHYAMYITIQGTFGGDEAIDFAAHNIAGEYIKISNGIISINKTELLGDIESALDELHAYAVALSGGEA